MARRECAMAALFPAERIGGLASLQPGLRPMSASGQKRKGSRRAYSVRITPVGSTGRRNTGVKSLCWGFKLQGLTWSFV
jgi:hypothetical protein